MFNMIKISDILNSKLLILLAPFSITLFLSCAPQPPQPVVTDNRNNPLLFSSDTTNQPRSSTKSSFFSRQSRRCPVTENAGICENDTGCLAACNEMFSNSRSRETCNRLSTDTVMEFQNIFDSLDTGNNIDRINLSHLNCFLSVSSTEFLAEVRQFNRQKSRIFLETVAAKEDFASVIRRADGDHNILEALLRRLGSADELLENFGVDIDSGYTFMGLVSQTANEDAWSWAIEYVRNQCSNDSDYCNTSDTYEGSDSRAKELVFFCNIFKDSNAGKQEIRDILQLDFFVSEYAEFIRRIPKCDSGSENCTPSDPDDFLGATGDATGEKTVCYYLGKVLLEN